MLFQSDGQSRSVITRKCKEFGCPNFFTMTRAALNEEILRGLSSPTRCPDCRRKQRQFLGQVGMGFWTLPSIDGQPLADGRHMGLGVLAHDDPQETVHEYDPSPTFELLERFKILDPVVDGLIEKLLEPQGPQVSIFVGPTGTGKTVWAPYKMLISQLGREGKICVTQPRTITLRAAQGKGDETTSPGFIAKELLRASGMGTGQEVGLLYGDEKGKFDRYTRLLFVTDGILIRWILSGQLARFRVLMIDEAHEQSSNMELIFALLRYHLPIYPRLKLVIASATVDVDKFRNFFGGKHPERVYIAQPKDGGTTRRTIHDRWPDGPDGYIKQLPGFKLPDDAAACPKAAAEIVRAICTKRGFTRLDPKGDILIFMPTTRSVRETVQAVDELQLPGVEAVPCHAQLRDREYAIFKAGEDRASSAQSRGVATSPQRVIVATPYAETSVTLSNLRYVIDSGYILEPEWNPVTCSWVYEVKRHSQAGCTQRKGRVGRIADGEVFRLYSQADFNNQTVFLPHTRPAIAREPLDKFLLAAKRAGVRDLSSFRWLGYDEGDETQMRERERAFRSLSKHGVIDREGDITRKGRELEGLRASSLDWAAVMSESDRYACSLEVATFLAFSERQADPFLEGPRGILAYDRFREGCYDDLEFFLRIFHQWEKSGGSKERQSWCASQGVDHDTLVAVEEAREAGLKEFQKRTHTAMSERVLDLARINRVRLVLARALHEWVYVKDAAQTGLFVPFDSSACPCSTPVSIERRSSCAGRSEVDAFLSVARSSYKDRVFAGFVIRLERDLIPKIQEANSYQFAKLLQASVLKDASQPDVRRVNQIARAPVKPPELNSYTRSSIQKFQCVRVVPGPRDNERKFVVARPEKGGQELLLLYEGGILDEGAIFRVSIERPNEDGSALLVTVRYLITLYREGTTLPMRKLRLAKELLAEGEKEPYGLLYELEPGITALLPRPDRELGKMWWKQLRAGKAKPLRVASVQNGRIRLGFVEPEITVGKTYNGIVDGELRPNNVRIGVFVLIKPGVVGLVHNSRCDAVRLNRLAKGNEVEVRLLSIREEGGRTRYELELV